MRIMAKKPANFMDWFNEGVNKNSIKESSKADLTTEELEKMFGAKSGERIVLPTDKAEKRRAIVNIVINAAEDGMDQGRIVKALTQAGFTTKVAQTALRLAKEHYFNERALEVVQANTLAKDEDDVSKVLAAFRRGDVSVKLDGIDTPMCVCLNIDGSYELYKELAKLHKKMGKQGVAEDEDVKRKAEILSSLNAADRKRATLREEVMEVVRELFPAKRGRGFDAFADITGIDVGDDEI